MNVTQHVTVVVVVTGAQPVCIDTHGAGEDGSHIAVRVGKIIVWLRDQRAAREYVNTWLDGVPAEATRYLPAARELTVDPVADHTPAIAITGSDLDEHRGAYDPNRRELIVRIGNVTWIIRDRATLDAHTQAWRRVSELAPLILPERTGR